MAWPVTSFDGVKFNAGSGWAEVVAIHLAIKERADAVGHSLASGDYADEWDTATKVWLGDPSDASAGDGRTYLRDVLSGFYADILSLLDDDADIRWTETGSASSAEWTEASLVADIAMGDFADLLTKPANHEPFLWLHEALDRLVYARVSIESGTATAASARAVRGDPQANLQDAWDDRDAGTGPSGPRGIYWRIDSFLRAHILSGYLFPFNMSAFSGTTSAGEYSLKWTNEATIPITFYMGSATTAVPASTPDSGFSWVASASADLPTGTTTNITLAVSTPEPSIVPFAAVGVFNGQPESSAIFLTCLARAYIDLTGVLADQA